MHLISVPHCLSLFTLPEPHGQDERNGKSLQILSEIKFCGLDEKANPVEATLGSKNAKSIELSDLLKWV